MILEECKQLLNFQAMNKNTLHKPCEKLKYCCKRRNKKMQVYQQFYINILPLTNL